MDTLLTATVFLWLCFSRAHGEPNNVCKTFGDYYQDLQHNPDCWYNPDVNLTAPEIIRRHGYEARNYTVTTKDGYILTVFRIVSSEPNTQPVFLQHGLGISCTGFLNLGNKSLALVLAANGYDVWLGNFRGTSYSIANVYLNASEKQYWNFTFDELGRYDLPAQIDLVARETNKKIVYIGYSMGTTAYYVYNSKYPEDAKTKLALSVSLAPVAALHYIRSSIKYVAPFWRPIEDLLMTLTNGALQRRTPTSLAIRAKVCLPYPIQMNFCYLLYNILYGFDYSQEDPETFPVTIMQNYDAVGVKILEHYAQLVISGKFRRFDYGLKNEEVYNTHEPPEYNLSAINIPNYLIRGNNDLIATEKNVNELYYALPKKARRYKVYLVKYKKFTHLDFSSAKDAKELVYDHIVKFLKANNL